MTNYDDNYKNVNVIYNKKLSKILWVKFCRKNKTKELETEKYPRHFLLRGREEEFSRKEINGKFTKSNKI